MNALKDYLFIDRARLRSYAEQIGVALKTDKTPEWKVGLSLTGPSVEGGQKAEARSANDSEMIRGVIDYLKKNGHLRTSRPRSDEDADRAQEGFVLKTMTARKIVFQCPPKGGPRGLREIVVWVSNPLETPRLSRDRSEIDYEARGMFVYLLEGYWDVDEFQRAYSMFTALNVLLKTLQSVKGVARSVETSRSDYSSPIAILERAGGIRGAGREIETFYRIRAASSNKIVNLGGQTVRSHDLFGYPIYIAAA